MPILQLFTPKQLVATGNETLLGQWGLLRTRNGEGHLDGLYEGLDWVPATLVLAVSACVAQGAPHFLHLSVSGLEIYSVQ